MTEPKRIGRYEIIEEIGRGGFATVYKARDTELDRVIALKVLHPQLTTDPRFIQRFCQEAQAAARLHHPHIVTVYEVGEEAGQYYLAMAFLPGRTLDKLVAEGPLPMEQAVSIVEQIASALDSIHEQRLVHRDVKPANVMLNDEGQATLLDFGIVRAAGGTQLTTAMTVLGTPEYMAPEQAEVEEAAEFDWRADVYALGVVAYEMLVGRLPFTGKSPTAVLYKHVHEPPPAPTKLNPDLPAALEPVLLKALAKSREERFQWAGGFARGLRRALLTESQIRQREAQLAPLYERLQAAAIKEEWAAVLTLGGRIQTLDPGYRDVPQLMAQAREQLRRTRRMLIPIWGCVASGVVVMALLLGLVGQGLGWWTLVEQRPTPKAAKAPTEPLTAELTKVLMEGPTAEQTLPRTVEPTKEPPPLPTEQLISEAITPPVSPTPTPPSLQLAFLHDGDIWLTDMPDGSLVQLTSTGDVTSFVWSPDGTRIATFNGRHICFTQFNGSAELPCVKLVTLDDQVTIHREMVWSPDQRYIVIWNGGWSIVAPDGSGQFLHISDPADWGMTFDGNTEPGGRTGEPLFLSDGKLIGTLTHRDLLCGSGGCSYELYQFDLQAQRFLPDAANDFVPSGWGEDLALSADGRVLANLGILCAGAGFCSTYYNVFYLDSRDGSRFRLEQEAFYEHALSPNGDRAVISRGDGCSSQSQADWAMQLWDLQADVRTDLVPGSCPDWAPDGSCIAFQSCLNQTPAGEWVPSRTGPPWIYVVEPVETTSRIMPIAEGTFAAWRP